MEPKTIAKRSLEHKDMLNKSKILGDAIKGQPRIKQLKQYTNRFQIQLQKLTTLTK